MNFHLWFDKLKVVFEKFDCLGEARLSDTGGSVFGVSIAEGIINLHGGKITDISKNNAICFTATFYFSAWKNMHMILEIP